jgi:endonuclease YncB( thermonuclease family)
MRTTRGLAYPPLVALVGLAIFAASAAEARRGPCLPGQKKPTCRISTGEVKAVSDGDTVNVKVKGVKKVQRVRLIGIEAMELTEYSRSRRRGECHSVEAADRLDGLVRNRTVRLSSRKPSTTSAGGRRALLRSVAVKQRGRWRDVGSILMAEGHALWNPLGKEWAWNRTYAKLAGFAARAGDGIWDTDHCGAGPGPDGALRLKVKWDADGSDGANPNGEFVRISNTSGSAVSLAGWWVRDALLRRYRFPASTVVPAGGSVVLRVGSGSNTGDTFFWRQPGPVFENVVAGAKAIGDGGYLFDPQGDLRASAVYPCRVGCVEPLQGKVELVAQPRTPESIRVTNISGGAIDLSEYEIESRPYFYEFARGTVLEAGQSVIVDVRADPANDTQFQKGWGRDANILGDNRDVVTLRNPLGGPVLCHAWGGASCPRA